MAKTTPPHLKGRTFAELAALEQARQAGILPPTLTQVAAMAHKAIDDAIARLIDKHGAAKVQIEVECNNPLGVASLDDGCVTYNDGNLTTVTVTIKAL